MTSIQGSINQNFSFSKRTLKDSIFLRAVGLLAVLAFSAAILVGWEEIKQLGAYGYPAVFLVSLIANAAFLLPAPGVALVFAAGGVLDPVAVGLIAGLGAAVGELTGYAVGMSGQTVFDGQPFYRTIESWMHKSGTLAIFVLAAVPNPLFDVGGLIAGVMRMPAWRFVLSAWLGKSLRFVILAYAGALVAW
ncbi:MAG: VTT domain-containing protein [Chloroflexota bacterium]|jgi:membrane protein YqaA with SNARE-associated domain